MRVVTLEEHFLLPEITSRISPRKIADWGWPTALPPELRRDDQLRDLGAGRIADLDRGGISVQVISTVGPGADLLTDEDGVSYARDYNDALAQAVAAHPDRLAGFAHLPMNDPEAAADELQRAVTTLGFRGAMIHGMTQGRFLDDPRFTVLLDRFEVLDVPLYLHPGLPPRAVYDQYFSDLPEHMGFLLSTTGWGWHSETGLHVMRMYLAGTFERHPRLQLIVGHMGEGLPAMLARGDKVFTPLASRYLGRTCSETLLQQVWITTSGFFDAASFAGALAAFGADRILFSIDYPYAPTTITAGYLNGLPISPVDRAKIAHGNADRLLKLDISD